MKYRCHFTRQGKLIVGRCMDVVVAKKRNGETITTNLQVLGNDMQDCQSKLMAEILSLEGESSSYPLETLEYDSKTGRWS